MKRAHKRITLSFLSVALMFLGPLSNILAQGTAFTYQGQLQNNGSPASGTYNLQFTLYATNSGGAAMAGPVTNTAVAVTNGLFTTLVNFGSVFTGQSNWLQIAVETNSAGATFTSLTPRQQLTPVPYAISAESISGGIDAAQLTSGTVPTNVIAGFQGPFFSTIDGGQGNVNYGEYDAIGGGQSNNVQGAYGSVGGGYDNSAGSGGYYATVAGGEANNASGQLATVGGGESDNADGQYATVSGGDINTAYGPYDFIGGGLRNIIYGDVYNYGVGTIAGGGDNGILVNSPGSFIGGGSFNKINGDVYDYGNAVIAGGAYNVISTNNPYSVIGGGDENTIEPGDYFFDEGSCVIAGGYDNFISVAGAAAIGGGWGNKIGDTNYDGGLSVIAGGMYNGTASGYCAIGGGGGNSIAIGAAYSTIAGGYDNSIAGDPVFSANQGCAFIGGGQQNQIGTNAPYAVIAGGLFNVISGDAGDEGTSFIGGGEGNEITNNSEFSVIAGGQENSIYTNCSCSVIGGGQNNFVESVFSGVLSGVENGILQDTNNYGASVIAGGDQNYIWPESYASVIAGGTANLIYQNAAYATIGGGLENEVEGAYATIPGGQGNMATGYASFAAGYYASANYAGDFVWSDVNGNFSSTGINQFLIQAQGGVGIGTNAPAAQLHVSSNGGGNDPQLRVDQLVNGGYSRIRETIVPTGASWDIASGGSPNTLNFFASSKPGVNGTNILILNPNGNATLWGTLAQGSDRAHKENLQPIDPQTVLARVAALPITKWNYLTEHGVEHLGPMAQDFYAAFQLGEDDKHITTVDEGGVALAAIQGLDQKLGEKESEIQSLKSQNSLLNERLDELQAEVKALAQK